MAYTTINKHTAYFNTKLYTGNGSTQSITGVGFQPDWCWLKNRSATQHHQVFDAVRTATKRIYPSSNAAEDTAADTLTAFDSDGFSLGANGGINGNGNDIVAWNWKANGAGSSNSNGSITSTVSVNTTAGFSIVKWVGNGSAGATIGHGLGATPAVIIEKITSSTGDWLVYHHKNTSAPETEFLRLSTDAATQDELTIWNDQAPTNQVFYVGTESTVNGNGNSCIAYCFAEKKGYSKFGSYTGNGNADGPFIYLGFKPAVVIIKQTNTSNHWYMWDNKRDVDNPTAVYTRPDTAGAEGNYDWLDFVSNGIKIRNTSSGASTNGGTYIYMAWAEEPLVANVGSSIPATAR